MAYEAVIPYESLDPLTIGASGDDDKVTRDTLSLEIPDDNLLAAIYPDRARAGGERDGSRTRRARGAGLGAALLRPVASASKVAVIIDNQFRPTPQSKLLPPVLDAIEAAGKPAVIVCANGKVFPMSDSDIDQKIGKDNLARMERLGIEFHQNDPRNADNYEYVGVSSRGTPVWLHKEVAACDVKITIGQAQSNHWGAGGGGKLILPGVVSDETIESNHCAFVPSPQTHYGAYAGPMRSDIDEVATMCGLSGTMNVVLDTHGRVIECIFGSHPDAHRKAIERFNEIYAYEHPGAQADIAICGVFAPDRPSLLPHGLGLHVRGLRREGRRLDHLLLAVPRRLDGDRRLPGPRAHGSHEAVHAGDARELPDGPQGHPRARDPDVGGLHLGADLRGDDAQASLARHARGEPRDGGRHRPRRDDLARRRVRGGDGAPRAGREGHRPAVCALPAAGEHGANGRVTGAVSGGGSGALTQRSVPGLDARGTSPDAPESREIKGSTTIVELLRMFPDGEAARLLAQLQMPCAHCGGAFHEPLTMAAKRHRRDPRAVIDAFRALDDGGPERPGSRPRSRASPRSRRRSAS